MARVRTVKSWTCVGIRVSGAILCGITGVRMCFSNFDVVKFQGEVGHRVRLPRSAAAAGR